MKEIRNQIRDVECLDNKIVVSWGDGHLSDFHLVWLRHQCECESCGSSLDGLRNNWILEIPEQLAVHSLSHDCDGISIVWEEDQHVSRYPAGWLREHCYSREAHQSRRHHVTLWDCRIGNSIPVFDVAATMKDRELRLSMLEKVRDLGFCRLTNVKSDLAGIEEVASLFGPVRQTHWGVSEINEKNAQYNVGDSGRALLPHMDETYRNTSVGITILQMVQPSEQGGHSILVDGFEVVRRVGEIDPEAFTLLSSVPVIFKRHHTGQSVDGNQRLLVSRTPIIKLDDEGQVQGVRINERHISPLDMDGDLVEPFYRALRLLFSITYSKELEIQLPLKSGEAMVFDNNRVLHGRTAFLQGHTRRHARTVTVDLDEFHSSMRLLQIDLQHPGANQIYYQGM